MPWYRWPIEIDGFTFKKIMYDVNQECIKIIKLTVDEPLEFDGG